MCGICGLVYFDREKPVSEDTLRLLTDSLAHRGPDDSGYFLAGHVGLGHRRPSIIDLERGHQPIFNEDESVVVVLNGEIYNFQELRQELAGSSHRFLTDSDTEVLVHGYEEWGIEGIWTLTNGPRAEKGSLEDCCEQLRFLLRDSVRLRRIADVPVGTFLSGGLDSSLITGLLSELVHPLNTFSIGFEQAGFDESPYSRTVSSFFRTEHQHLIRQVYEVEPLVCARCGGTMKIIAVIEQPAVVRQILDHVGLPSRPARLRAPPELSVRGTQPGPGEGRPAGPPFP